VTRAPIKNGRVFTVDFLNELRAIELNRVIPRLRPGARILEIGAGTGRQALELRRRGFDVEAIEVADSRYVADRAFPITDYDGRHIPFADGSFDIVFSSNVLEHVPDLAQMHAELRRVLKPGGYCVHLMPTGAWRFWTSVTNFPTAFQKIAAAAGGLGGPAPSVGRRLLRIGAFPFHAVGLLLAPFFQTRHGERGTVVSELWSFRPRWWRRTFARHGFEVVRDEPLGLIYTGNFFLGRWLTFADRDRWAKRLGSACHLYEVRPGPTAGDR
jgi:SAM-dependent methyltransferase